MRSGRDRGPQCRWSLAGVDNRPGHGAGAAAKGAEGSKRSAILEREPTGEDRPRDDGALVRVTVPAWGIIRVREGDPDMVSGFADVQASMVMGKSRRRRCWDGSEDVTHPESAPFASFVRNRDFARETMTGVLEKAGQRLRRRASVCKERRSVTGRLARISILLSLLLPTISGCGTAGLDVHYPEARVNRTVLASAPPRRVEIRPVADRRMDTTRIGVKPNNEGDIVTSRPVANLVREALVLELSKNGHSVRSQRAGGGPGSNGRGFPDR